MESLEWARSCSPLCTKDTEYKSVTEKDHENNEPHSLHHIIVPFLHFLFPRYLYVLFSSFLFGFWVECVFMVVCANVANHGFGIEVEYRKRFPFDSSFGSSARA